MYPLVYQVDRSYAVYLHQSLIRSAQFLANQEIGFPNLAYGPINIPWAEKIWALPFLTVLAPSERYYAKGVRQPKKLTDWDRQKGKQVRRWLPTRKIVLVADSTYAALGLLDSLVRLSEPV